MKQTEKMWRRMMRLDAILVEKLDRHEEAVEYAKLYNGGKTTGCHNSKDILPEHIYWLFLNEYRTL